MKNPATNTLQVLDYQDTLSMTSLEISELSNKRHANVRRTIETLAKSGIIQLTQIEKVENDQSLSPNNASLNYVFTGAKGKRDTLVVIARLSPEFTAALVDRWEALEKENLRLLQENITAELTILQANAADSDLERQKLLQTHIDDTNALQRAEQRLEEYAAKISHLEYEVEDRTNQLQYSQAWMDKARHHFKKMSRRMAHLEMEANTAQANYDELLYQEYCKRFADWKRPFHKPASHPKVQGLIKLGWLEPCGTVATPIGRYLVDVRPSDSPGVYGYSLSSLGHAYSGSYARGVSKVLAATLYRIPAHKHANLEKLGIMDDDFIGLLLN